MARGSPSSCSQIWPIGSALVSVRAYAGAVETARSTKRSIASSVIGGMTHTCSFATPRAMRLVARTPALGHSRSRRVATSAQAGATCSQLSRTTRARRPRRALTTARSALAPDGPERPSAAATSAGTSAGFTTGPSGTQIDVLVSHLRGSTIAEPLCHLDGQTRLAQPAHTADSQQTSRRKGDQSSEFTFPADEAREIGGQPIGEEFLINSHASTPKGQIRSTSRRRLTTHSPPCAPPKSPTARELGISAYPDRRLDQPAT